MNNYVMNYKAGIMQNMQQNKYQAVIFDLFGTLVNNYSIQQSYRALAEMATVLSAPPQLFFTSWTVDTWPLRALGKLTTIEHCIKYICDQMKIPVCNKQIMLASQIWLERTRHTLSPRIDAIETLVKLKSYGYRIGVVSDCSAEVSLHWKQSDFISIVDVVILSCEVGFKKPDPHIYWLASERLSILPQRCLYIGDGSSHELSGARRANMNPICIKGDYEDPAMTLHPDAEEWQGPSITKLKDTLDLLDNFQMITSNIVTKQ